jgi:hypothetical protein
MPLIIEDETGDEPIMTETEAITCTRQHVDDPVPGDKLCEDLRELLNRHNAENGSDTADFILAKYLRECLRTFDYFVRYRSSWYGRHDEAGKTSTVTAGGIVFVGDAVVAENPS